MRESSAAEAPRPTGFLTVDSSSPARATGAAENVAGPLRWIAGPAHRPIVEGSPQQTPGNQAIIMNMAGVGIDTSDPANLPNDPLPAVLFAFHA